MRLLPLAALRHDREQVMRRKFFVKCCTLSSANSTGARECAAHHGMALEPFNANW
jgi:hypothetical protein